MCHPLVTTLGRQLVHLQLLSPCYNPFPPGRREGLVPPSQKGPSGHIRPAGATPRMWFR